MPRSTTVSKPKRATKTFSGCWTCRERHVKCDEGRPSCARCLKGGFVCHGYGIKLVWIDPETRGWEQKIRRVVSAPVLYHDDSAFIKVDVQDALDRLDQGEACSIGPFSVFSVHEETDTRESNFDEPLEFDDVVLSDTECLSGSSVHSLDHDHGDEQDAGEIVVLPFTAEPSSPAEYWSPSISRHLDLLPRPAEQRQLIHHWVTFVSWHLVPVDRPDNPFRSVFTPMALAGLNSLSCESNGQIALFHSLCATSAYSRGQLSNDARALTLAGKHYHLAILHLRHSLANLTSDDADGQRDAIIATITMFSVMDMITGRSSEWRTHFQGGASLLATSQDQLWKRDKSSSMIYQSYLAVAALCNIDLPSTIDVASDACEDYVLDRFFGLTRPILQHIVRVNALLRDASAQNLHPALLDKLESELRAPTPEHLNLEGLDDPQARELARHHAYVFYYASLIHFQRAVRQTAPAALQDLVERAVDHLEEIERLGADTVGCTLIWPPLVVACECECPELRARVLAWYRLKRRHGFMNLEISKDVAQEVWRRRDSEVSQDDVRWQDILADMKLDIVLA
ncbi:hypothetical protein A1O3_09130 [Capronia epimyces CBS 606.96]|uniref:Zn(2)-C6 fungal-type domain-containing protein n=1 Tax=Capronia epimyces CBS 606.96 TaxID=1182542 RepID=W9XLX3_9EURO|nr:uncharacterized protein A1O3_09130 [Capronia epimyces CBS 606.96]EXJ77971.1 hypothetical protein A1O3_09130 [Capronia epimyces CBS 606.96]